MLAARRQEIGNIDDAPALRLQARHELGQGHVIRGEILGVTPEMAHGLEMDAAHMGLAVQPETHDVPELVRVHAARHRGHQDDAQARRRCIVHRPNLDREQVPAAQGTEDFFTHPVELQKDGRQTRLGQLTG